MHDLHNDYPLAPESIKITKTMISPKTKEILQLINSKHTETNKLVPNLMNKSNYVVHYRTLQLYLKLGLKIKKVNKVLTFKQSPWLKPY